MIWLWWVVIFAPALMLVTLALDKIEKSITSTQAHQPTLTDPTSRG